MFAPVMRKVLESRNILIERALPNTGSIRVQKGELVRPFDKLGDCAVSKNKLILPPNFEPLKNYISNQFYYVHDTLGKVSYRKVEAPFNGKLAQNNQGIYVYEEVPTNYVLLSGLWGKVEEVVPNKSVLIRTQTKDINFALSNNLSFTGELVVFPNPMEILEKFYLEEFSKGEGKIVYLGHFADLEAVKKAVELGVRAVIAGSAHKETMTYAKKQGLGFGLITGLGKLETSDPVFKLLSLISYRHVFFQGDRGVLRIPVPSEETNSKRITVPRHLKRVRKGLYVQILQKPYFGTLGVVTSVLEDKILVKLDKLKEPLEISYPNFIIFE